MYPNRIIEEYRKNLKEIEESCLNEIKVNFNLTESNLDKIGKKYKEYLNQVKEKVVQVINQIKENLAKDLEKGKLQLDNLYKHIELLKKVYKLAPQDIKTKISKECLEVFNISNREGNTFVMLTAKYGKENLLKDLYKVPDHLTKDSYYTEEEESKIYELCNDSYTAYNQKNENALMLAIKGEYVSCIKYLISAELIQKLISKRLLEYVFNTTDNGKYKVLNEFVRVVDEITTRRKNKYHPEERFEIEIESSFFQSFNNEVRKAIEVLPIKIVEDTQNNFSSLEISSTAEVELKRKHVEESSERAENLETSSNDKEEFYPRKASVSKSKNLIDRKLNSDQDTNTVEVETKRKRVEESSERAENLETSSNDKEEFYLRRASALKAQNLIVRQLNSGRDMSAVKVKRKHVEESSERAENLIALQKLLEKKGDFNSQQEYEKSFCKNFSKLSNDDKVKFVSCHRVELREVLSTPTLKEYFKEYLNQQHDNLSSRFHLEEVEVSCGKRQRKLGAQKKVEPITTLIACDSERVNYKMLSHV